MGENFRPPDSIVKFDGLFSNAHIYHKVLCAKAHILHTYTLKEEKIQSSPYSCFFVRAITHDGLIKFTEKTVARPGVFLR
jgi:hypothetical protein